MYRNDDQLPKLPLPDVPTTLERLHRTLLPFNPLVLKEPLLEQAAALSDAHKLLKGREGQQVNWLGDWWDEFAYLRARYPVVINSNIMAARLLDMDPVTWKAKPVFSNPVERTAMCITESLYFRTLMIAESVKEVIPVAKPLCMTQFRRYYGMRKPGKGIDSAVFQKPIDAVHAVVMYRGRMGSIKVADPKDPSFSLNFPELVAAVQRIVDTIDERAEADRQAGVDWLANCVGALTAAERDAAAEGFQQLSGASEDNRRYLDRLFNSCLTIVSIDDEEVRDVSHGILVAAHKFPHNRWYDRATSQIVAKNGVGMYQGEHSPMDAIVSATTPVEIVSRFAIQYVKEKRYEGQTVRHDFSVERAVEVFSWTVPEACQAIIRKAIDEHNTVSSACEAIGYRFSGYGRSFLATRKVSPDFLVQAALQLALLEDSGSCGAVYESASTRAFQQGRTETIRAHSLEQKALVEALQKTDIPQLEQNGLGGEAVQRLKKLLLEAQRRHGVLSAEASSGQGVDRHLLGLRIASGALQKELPPLFQQTEVAAAQNFVLLTSQMIGETYLGGFAHSLPYGYGCCYYIHKDRICICISCNSIAKKTSCERFGKHLTRAFEKFGALLKHFPDATQAGGAGGAAQTKSRL